MDAPTRWAWAVAGVIGPAAGCGGQVKADGGTGGGGETGAAEAGTVVLSASLCSRLQEDGFERIDVLNECYTGGTCIP